MRSDSELQIFTFRSDEWIGLLMQSDIAKSDGIKSNFKIRWPKSDFGPQSDDSVHRTLTSKKGIGLFSSKNVAKLLRIAWYSSSTSYTQMYE